MHDRAGLDRLVGLYDAINIKLDKTGGLTEALALAAAAEQRGFSLMIGCMVGSSLAMAPAMVLAPRARFVDLDGPLPPPPPPPRAPGPAPRPPLLPAPPRPLGLTLEPPQEGGVRCSGGDRRWMELD